MTMATQRPVISCAVLGGGVMLLLAAGCSSTSSTPAAEYAQVTGHVRYHGKSIIEGQITVLTDAGAFDSAPIADGQYVLSRAPVGTVHVVLVGATEKVDPKQVEAKKWAEIKKGAERIKAWQAEGKKVEDLPPEPVPEDPNRIPSKYSGHRSTPLTREVKPGSQIIDLDIESKTENKPKNENRAGKQ
jgi:hypothetical protein